MLAKLCLQYAKQWELSPAPLGGDRPYWWGGMGKACERAMWVHCLRDELAGSCKVATATLVAGGSKFYEHIEPGLLRSTARGVGYPKRLLRRNML